MGGLGDARENDNQFQRATTQCTVRVLLFIDKTAVPIYLFVIMIYYEYVFQFNIDWLRMLVYCFVYTRWCVVDNRVCYFALSCTLLLENLFREDEFHWKINIILIFWLLLLHKGIEHADMYLSKYDSWLKYNTPTLRKCLYKNYILYYILPIDTFPIQKWWICKESESI